MDYSQQLKDRLAESLNPEMQARYKKRKTDAVAAQSANYQGPEAVEALADGARTRALYSGLARAANKFGSVGGDGGQATSVPETMKDFGDAAQGEFDTKQAAYGNAVKAEDAAIEGIDGLQDRSVKLAGDLDGAERTTVMRGRDDEKYGREQAMEKDEDDPNSEISRTYQQMAKTYTRGQKDFTGMSAAKLKGMSPLMASVYQVEEQTRARRDQAQANKDSQTENRLDREAAREESRRASKETRDAEYGRRREDKLTDDKRAQDNKPPSEGQTNAALYVKRMESAQGEMDSLERDGFDRTGAGPAFRDAALPEAFTGERSKMQTQAERNFLTAVLRRESGASISPGELDTGSKIYFPRLNDSPAVLAQKKQARKDAISGVKAAAGKNAVGNVQDASGENAGPKVYSSGSIPEAD